MILPVVGQSLMLLAALAALGGGVLGVAGARRASFARHSELAGRVLFGASLLACGALLLALLASDFTLAYVAERTNRDLSAGFRLTALWSGQEGSLLLWLTMLAGFGVLMVRSARRAGAPADLISAANGVLLLIASFFAVLVAFVARPFAVAETIARDGAGMSPTLQNYWMALHPPALYVGYVAIAVPFAIVMGALIVGRRDDAWVSLTRRWSLVAWCGLTLGLLLGARWAYEEIGWGGYWAWDPVENAALMPWLTITAFIHSVMVQERRGMMRFWNVVLVSLTFCLSIFGTFLTRSGVLSSVHSFVSSPVGWWFVGFLALAIAVSLVMLWRSRELLRARNDVESVVSREAVFLFNNLLLVAIALTVLWGVLFPILSASFGSQRVSLQAPWFEFFTIAFGLPLLVMMAIGPVVPWRRGSARGAAARVRVPFALAVAAGCLLLALGYGSSVPGVAAVSFGIFVVAGMAGEFARGVAARRREQPGLTRVRALGQLFSRNQRRYGGYLAHTGVGLLAIAVAGSSAFDSSRPATLQPGDSVRHAGWNIRYLELDRTRTANSMETRGRFEVWRTGSTRRTLEAGRNFYPASGEISNEVGIRHDLLRASDLMVIVDRLTEDGEAQVKIVSNPLVSLLWAAGLLIAVGGAIAAAPRTRQSAGRAREASPIGAPASSGFGEAGEPYAREVVGAAVGGRPEPTERVQP